MKKILLTSALLIIGSTLLVAQLKQGEFAVGGNGLEQGYAIVQSTDGGYVFTGYTQSYADTLNGAMYVCKLDATGKLAWTRTIDGKYGADGLALTQLNDKGFAVVGATTSFGDTAAEDIYIVKLDSAGNFKWSRTIGGPADDRGNAVIQDKAGNIVICGYTSSYGLGYQNFYLIKLDMAGNLKWTRTVGGTRDDAAYGLAQTTDGGYVMAGMATSYGDTLYGDLYVVKVDSSGNFKWGTTVGGAGADQGDAIAATKDGGCIATGYTDSYGAGNSDVYVVKLDSLGKVKWTKVIGGKNAEYGNSVIQTNDGGYAVAGLTESFVDTLYQDTYFIKLDSAGNVQWTKAYGGNSYDESNSVVQTMDGGYALAGETDSFGAGSWDIYIIKTDSAGNSCSSSAAGGMISSGGISFGGGVADSGGAITSIDSGRVGSGGIYTDVCSVITSISEVGPDNGNISVYPNPSSALFTFKFGHPKLVSGSHITVYNEVGEKVYDGVMLNQVRNDYQINLASCSAGIYFYRITSDKGKSIASGKLVKE